MNFSKFGVLSEIIVYYNEKSSILVNDTIRLMNNFYRCSKNNLELLSIKSVKDVYRNTSSISDESGTISIFDTTSEEKTPILESWYEKLTQIVFFTQFLRLMGKRLFAKK